ncbi:MAG: GLPGLI family protein [Flavobacteriales bacterium]|jgi:GLPGLI family protein|nr:GLPGLI family protein [Flavobacteriales bacterium]
MKTLLLPLCLIFGWTLSSNAQSTLEGTAYYTVKSKVIIDFSNMKAPPERQKRIKGMLNEASMKQYVLQFDSKGRSLYTKPNNESAESASSSHRAKRMAMMSTLLNQGSSQYFVDTKAQQTIDKREMYGKTFSIQNALGNFEWEITGETKKIGKYTCVKALAKTKEYPPFEPKFGKKRSEKQKIEQIESEIIAWFTLDIPVPYGPDKFNGLPGLILELKTNSLTFLCSKVQLNSQEAKEIEKPKGGKKISKSEYDALFVKKTKEIEQQMKNRRRSHQRRK